LAEKCPPVEGGTAPPTRFLRLFAIS